MEKKKITLLFYLLIFFLFSKVFAFSQELSISEIVKRASPSVVQIIIYDITGTQRGEGSGFFIAPGEILTNAHVVEDAYSAEIFSEIEYYKQIKILKIDKETDLALLEVFVRGEASLLLEEKQEIRPGQRIITIGNPMGLEKTVSDGLVSAVRGIPGLIQVIQISAPISPGSSGGPLLNLEGHVVGVTSAMVSEGQNLNFAIGIDTIKNFLISPDNPQLLHEARTRVLWRVILKWIVNIVLGFIALVFGGGWWIIIIIFLIGSLVVWFAKSIYRLIKAPFRKKQKDISGSYEIENKSDSYEQLINKDEFSDEEELSPDIEDEKDEDKYIFSFHCWKCGSEVNIDSFDMPDSMKCWNCGVNLSIPDEKKMSIFVEREINQLITKGKKQGYLLFEEIDEFFQDDLFTKKDFKNFVNELDKYGIKILDTTKG